MEWTDQAFLLSCRAYGESQVVAQVLTRHHGRCAGLIYGGQSRSKQGALQAGNLLEVQWRARLQEQLGYFVCELGRVYGARILSDADRLSAMTSALALLEHTLAEREPHEECFLLLQELLRVLVSADDWLDDYLRWECDLLSVLGYGLPSFASGVQLVPTNRCKFFDTHTWNIIEEPFEEAQSQFGSTSMGNTRLVVPEWFLKQGGQNGLNGLNGQGRESGQSRGQSRGFMGRKEFSEALEFFANLLRIRVFYPVNKDIPSARRRLTERFVA